MAKRQKVADMSCAAIETVPVNFDWRSRPVGDGENEWEWWEAVECHKCGRYAVVNSGGGEMHSDCSKTKCDGTVGEAEGPMMSCYYPLPENGSLDVRRASLAIRHLPLVLVRFDGDDDNWALALSGGGMDLSWQICEAFMRLGYLPPTHFELPAMCGRGVSSKDRWILRGYLRACKIQRGWLVRKAERAREAVAFGVKHEADRESEQGKAVAT